MQGNSHRITINNIIHTLLFYIILFFIVYGMYRLYVETFVIRIISTLHISYFEFLHLFSEFFLLYFFVLTRIFQIESLRNNVKEMSYTWQEFHG